MPKKTTPANKKTAAKTTKKADAPKVEKKVSEKSHHEPKEAKETKNIFQRHENDTGSPEKQIELLSAEITMLQGHLQQHAKDVDAKRSLFKKVARRRKFLKYLKQNHLDIYLAVSKKLDMKV